MQLLATQAMPQMRRHEHPHLGRLVTPRHYPSTAEHPRELVWAADNDCFNGLDAPRWLAMLETLERTRDRGRLVFCTVPDVVADARATAELFERWAPELERRELPLGLVLQDGLEDLGAWLERTWPRLAAVFVGGSDAFKLGEHARELVADAKRRGLWAHVGRVNSYRRMRYAHEIGADSVDGTKWTRFRDAYLDGGLAYLASLENQATLELAA